MIIKNIENLNRDFVWQDSAGLITQSLGAAVGSEKIYVNIDRVPTGAFSTKYHSHSMQEEFFLILEGSGTLRCDGKEYPVKKGDFISKPGGQNLAHQFYNSGSEVMVILDVGTKEPEDTCFYPDEGVYLHKSNGEHHIFSKQSLLENWASDPNEK